MKSVAYSRLYHRLMTEFPTVWRSEAQLGLYVQMLVIAEKFYPECPVAPRKGRSYRALVASGLVIEQDGGCYSIRGLSAERERRSSAGRIGAAKRWQSDGNATALLDETRRDETSSVNGQSPTTFMGWRPKAERAPGEAALARHDGSHTATCSVCHPIPRSGVDA